MGLFRPSRERYGPDPYYHWKVILFTMGAGIGLFGMISNRDWLVLVAIPVLAAGVALRWLGRQRPGDDSPEDEPPDSADTPDER